MNRQTNEQMNNQMNEWMNTLIRGSYEHPIWAGDAHKTVEFNACSIYKVCGNMLSGEIFSVTVRDESDVADRKVWWWPRLLFSGTIAPCKYALRFDVHCFLWPLEVENTFGSTPVKNRVAEKLFLVLKNCSTWSIWGSNPTWNVFKALLAFRFNLAHASSGPSYTLRIHARGFMFAYVYGCECMPSLVAEHIAY